MVLHKTLLFSCNGKGAAWMACASVGNCCVRWSLIGLCIFVMKQWQSCAYDSQFPYPLLSVFQASKQMSSLVSYNLAEAEVCFGFYCQPKTSIALCNYIAMLHTPKKLLENEVASIREVRCALRMDRRFCQSLLWPMITLKLMLLPLSLIRR